MMSNGAWIEVEGHAFALMALNNIQTLAIRDAEVLHPLKKSFDFQKQQAKSLRHSSPTEVELFFDGLLGKNIHVRSSMFKHK